MAAMTRTVDDSVGAIIAELSLQKILDNTCVVFTSDNGSSQESRNWLGGNEDPYYGGSTGSPRRSGRGGGHPPPPG
jgi:arylsulfatase A-like enzyme